MHFKLAGMMFLGLFAVMGAFSGACSNWAGLIVSALFGATALALLRFSEKDSDLAAEVRALRARLQDTRGELEHYLAKLDEAHQLATDAKALAGRATLGRL